MKINFFSCLLWKPIYLFIYLHIYLLLVLLFAKYNALCTSIPFLKAKGFSFSGLFQNLNFCHVKCVCQILFMLTRYLDTSWPLLPLNTLGFAMNERQRLRTHQLPCVQDISSHRFSYLNSDKLMSSKRILHWGVLLDQGCIQASRVMRPVQNRMDHSRQKYLRSQQIKHID